MTRHQHLVFDIAEAVGSAERTFQRMIGADWETAYRADVEATNEVCEIAASPERNFYSKGHYYIRRSA